MYNKWFYFQSHPHTGAYSRNLHVCHVYQCYNRKAGAVQGISPQELVIGRTVNYKRNCRTCIGGHLEGSTDAMVNNDNQTRNHSCIALETSGKRQGSVKCFDLETGKVVVHRTINQISWPEK